MLETIITSKTRLNLLVKFFVNFTNRDYLNSLANQFGESTNSVRKELNNLTQAGYLVKKNLNNKVIYSANVKHPLVIVLQKIVRKHLGIESIVEKIINKIGSIDKIVLQGDYAEGIDSGVIEVLIFGQNIDEIFLKKIQNKIEKEINRKIIFYINSTTTKANKLVVFES